MVVGGPQNDYKVCQCPLRRVFDFSGFQVFGFSGFPVFRFLVFRFFGRDGTQDFSDRTGHGARQKSNFYNLTGINFVSFFERPVTMNNRTVLLKCNLKEAYIIQVSSNDV